MKLKLALAAIAAVVLISRRLRTTLIDVTTAEEAAILLEIERMHQEAQMIVDASYRRTRR